jgi:hypothetical protein
MQLLIKARSMLILIGLPPARQQLAGSKREKKTTPLRKRDRG